MKHLVALVGFVLMGTPSLFADIVYDIQFNDAASTVLDNAAVTTGASFNTNPEVDGYGSTDGSGSMVWNNMSVADTSFANLITTEGPFNISSSLDLIYTVRLSNWNFDADASGDASGNDRKVAFQLRDGSKTASLFFRTSNSGQGIQLRAQGYSQTLVNGGTLYNSGNAGTNNMTHAGWEFLEAQWIVDLDANTYDVNYRTAAADSFANVIDDAAFGLGAGDGTFVELDRTRLGVATAFTAGSSVSIDYITVQAVPEASTLSLLTTALLASLISRKRYLSA